MELQNGFLVFSLFTVFYSIYSLANSHDETDTKAAACKNETLQGLCTAKCGDYHACVLGKCFCLQPSPAYRKGHDDSQSTEPQIIKLRAYDEQLSGEEEFEYRQPLRHHIAHFCPDLEKARKCIKRCIRHGKAAFCGKDHVCYCGHKYDTSVDDEKLDAASIYAEFKDLYAKYFGVQQ